MPTNTGGSGDFLGQAVRLQESILEAPIHPGHVLTVTSYMGSYHGHPSPGTRELPRLVRHCTGYNVTTPLLVLQARIQGGDGKWSQVWKGFMTSQNFPDVSPVPVIIKLFQESYLGFVPTLEDLWGNLDYAEWLPGARLAANEAWAYDRMRALQGCSVPWSYGFCKCLLPNGEATFGYIMEVIEGPTASMATPSELGLDEGGVLNRRCSCYGITRYAWDCNVILLDFALCRTFGPPSERTEVALEDMASITEVFSALGMKLRTRDWFRSRLQMNVPFGEELAELDQAGWLAPRKPASIKFEGNWEIL